MLFSWTWKLNTGALRQAFITVWTLVLAGPVRGGRLPLTSLGIVGTLLCLVSVPSRTLLVIVLVVAESQAFVFVMNMVSLVLGVISRLVRQPLALLFPIYV